MSVVGALILSRQRANRVGWILCAIAVAQSLALNLSVTDTALGLYIRPGSVPLPLWPPLLSQIGLIPGASLVLIGLPLFFQTGMHPAGDGCWSLCSRRWLSYWLRRRWTTRRPSRASTTSQGPSPSGR